MNLQPVIVELRTGNAKFLGILAGSCGTVLLVVGLFWAASGALAGDGVFLGGLVVIVILSFAAFYLGLAIRKPVALRMDAHGISGYFAEPSVWPEIMTIESWESAKGRRYLGFAFLNPDIIHSRQSRWRRFCNWSRNPNFGDRFQIVIPEALLMDGGVEHLAAQARAFHRMA